jgi:hypothetical protein
MAAVRNRNGNLSLVFWWKGKQYIKTLKTANEDEAEQLKSDAEDQLDRIRQGKSPLAAKLLAGGIPITDVDLLIPIRVLFCAAVGAGVLVTKCLAAAYGFELEVKLL